MSTTRNTTIKFVRSFFICKEFYCRGSFSWYFFPYLKLINCHSMGLFVQIFGCYLYHFTFGNNYIVWCELRILYSYSKFFNSWFLLKETLNFTTCTISRHYKKAKYKSNNEKPQVFFLAFLFLLI